MTFVLTNDDGIDAPGIKALYQALQDYGVDHEANEVIVVAPQEHHSGCGHQVTTSHPIQIHPRSQQEFAIGGTPADCTRVALSHLCSEVDWVLSGINAGGNLGADTYISGTVAAVREAALHGIPGIAISHYRKGKRPIHWETAARWTATVVNQLLRLPLDPGSFWNVNLPHLEPDDPDPELVFCPLSTQPLPVNYRVEGDQLIYVGDYAQRSREPGSDVDVCFSGQIAVTKIQL
ncbi:5'/3'-nucleotidase SurE [Leptolyngbya sp. 'hensonii']|uniref:5'/3'-nucleotidase SurE n=1 Tax=Leptolyngbya sp. 'hensonii' TaxID=1922337 RepID=UPI00094FC6A3|nr:5'/3'-nucleotidase SurE [Leptolyngbya sp. 'hensonii']OLP17695.1 5'/3'-nucleotidase SurE [Leptolyngbya sp. 'hensonii']